jgi:hypothetical protein
MIVNYLEQENIKIENNGGESSRVDVGTFVQSLYDMRTNPKTIVVGIGPKTLSIPYADGHPRHSSSV